MLVAAPLLMTSLQFAAQNLMARLVMRCGLIRKAQDKEALSWRQYAKEGMLAPCHVVQCEMSGHLQQSYVHHWN